MKTRRTRSKPCAHCGVEAKALFRARLTQAADWLFLCEPCLLRAKEGHPEYQYGGTWKARKRH